MEQVMVEWRVGCEDSGHLIVVRRMDVLINTVACELHLQREGRVRTHHRSLQGGCKGQKDRPGVPQAHLMLGMGCGSLLATHTLAKCRGGNMLLFAEP